MEGGVGQWDSDIELFVFFFSPDSVVSKHYMEASFVPTRLNCLLFYFLTGGEG